MITQRIDAYEALRKAVKEDPRAAADAALQKMQITPFPNAMTRLSWTLTADASLACSVRETQA